jgi:hypothetical protein
MEYKAKNGNQRPINNWPPVLRILALEFMFTQKHSAGFIPPD